jgi:hypothetical protein
VADAAALFENHRVHRAHGPRCVGQLVKKRQHGLFEGMGDVHPAKAPRLDPVQQGIDGFGRPRGIDKLVAIVEPVRRTFLGVHARRPGCADPVADQADLHRHGRPSAVRQDPAARHDPPFARVVATEVAWMPHGPTC